MEFVKKTIVGNDILHVIRIRPFFFMMISQFFSNLAFNMQHFVLIFIVFGLTRSNTAVAALILSFTVPAVLFSVITGVHVDRWDKRKVLFFTNLIRGLLILPFLIPNIHMSFIYTLTFLIALATQYFLPASSSIIPHLIPKKLIISANSFFYAEVYATIFLGYILAGPLLLLLGKTYTIILLSLLFFASTFFSAFIKPRYTYPDPKHDSKVSFFAALHEIFPFIKKTIKVLHALAVLTIAQAIIFMFAVLGPGYVSTVLHVPIESLSLILIAPASFGMLLGVFFLGSIGKKFEFRWLAATGFMLSGIIFFLFPYSRKITSAPPSFFDINIFQTVIAFSVVIGFAISLIFVSGNATIQAQTSEKLRGRIYGLLNALTGGVSFLPVALSGGLADLFGVGTVIAAVGVLMIIISGIIFAFG